MVIGPNCPSALFGTDRCAPEESAGANIERAFLRNDSIVAPNPSGKVAVGRAFWSAQLITVLPNSVPISGHLGWDEAAQRLRSKWGVALLPLLPSTPLPV